MDPLSELRGEIGYVGPLGRTGLLMSAQERREEAAAEARRYEKQAEAEAVLQAMVSRERLEKYTQGHTNRELARFEADREALRQAKIEEHERALRQLRGQPEPGVQRSALPVETEILRGWRAGERCTDDPYMADQVRRFDARQHVHDGEREQDATARRQRMPIGVQVLLGHRQ
jgi:hypothetical protein